MSSVMSLPLLSTLIWMPIVGSVILLCCQQMSPCLQKRIGLYFSLASCLGAVALLLAFTPSHGQLQLMEHILWLPQLGVNYSLGVDGFAVPLIVLTALMTFIVVLGSYQSVHHRVGQYIAAFLMMQGMLVGVFCAADALLFYIFFEAMLIPMFLIIGIWGGKNRIYATFKFFLYTFFGSIFLLLALIYLRLQTYDFDIQGFSQLNLSLFEQQVLFFAFLIAFAVKVPMWPVHTWLPDAHTEAPTGGSVILAAITLKVGGYAMVRLLFPILPDACQYFADWIIVLSLIAIVYIALVALVQSDMKKLIAYSSISHMGFVTLGFFLIFSIVQETQELGDAVISVQGAMVQMISHGFISGALFLCVGVLYDRLHSRAIKDYGGVVNTMPLFASFFMLFAMANSGLPGTSGFVGEFLVILSAFKANFWVALLAALTLIFGASYSLWMYKRVVFGKVMKESVASLKDLEGTEKMMLSLLAGLVLLFGLWPAPLFNLMESSVQNFVQIMFR